MRLKKKSTKSTGIDQTDAQRESTVSLKSPKDADKVIMIKISLIADMVKFEMIVRACSEVNLLLFQLYGDNEGEMLV